LMRSKEEANDYRYFPDPDLPPLVVAGELMGSILRELPELPIARFERYTKLGIAPDDARTLISDRALADYFDAACAAIANAQAGKQIGNWMLTELLGALNAEHKDIRESPMMAETLADLVTLVVDGTISGKIGKEIFTESYQTGEAPLATFARSPTSRRCGRSSTTSSRRTRSRPRPTRVARTGCSGSSLAGS